jgi:hypothetical protein
LQCERKKLNLFFPFAFGTKPVWSYQTEQNKPEALKIVLIQRYLDEIPVSSRLGDLVGDGTAGCTKEDQLLRIEVDHVKKGLEADAGIALKPRKIHSNRFRKFFFEQV